MDKKFMDIVSDFLHTYVKFSSEQEMDYALNNINGNINLLSDWGLDSLDVTHFVMSLEYEYDIIITDEEAVNAFKYLSKVEGIIPALESSHAIAYTMKIAGNYNKDDIIVICLSGRGDKDLDTIFNY